MRPDLIGRTTECRALEECLDAVRDGRSQVLVLQGEPGIGKSALLQYLTGAASDFRVLLATGFEQFELGTKVANGQISYQRAGSLSCRMFGRAGRRLKGPSKGSSGYVLPATLGCCKGCSPACRHRSLYLSKMGSGPSRGRL